MFFKIDESSEYCNYFNTDIYALMDGYKDFVLVFNQHIVIVREMEKHNFELSVVEIKKENDDGTFLVNILIENIKFESFTNISYEIMQQLRKLYPEFDDLDFPIEKSKFKAVDNSEDILYTEE